MNSAARVCLLWISAWGIGAAQQAPDPAMKRVLLVHSFGRDFAPFTQVAEGFREELTKTSPQPIEFWETSLEITRFDGGWQESALTKFLESVTRDHKPDLVVSFGAPAMEFCHRNRALLFPQAAVLAAGADKRRTAALRDEPWLASVDLDVDLETLAASIRQLLPDLRNLYVVIGTTPLERYWERLIRTLWPDALPGVEIHWLSDKPMREITAELGRVPPRSAVFHGIMVRDAAGVQYEHESALAAVHRATAAPVFGYSAEQMGAGIVGGPLTGMRNCGHLAAAVAVRLLAGESPAGIEVPPLKANPPTYDWRELKRWNIPASRLPAGSSILYRPPPLWETHRSTVLLAAAAILLQNIWIIRLAAARKRARENGDQLRLATEAAQIGLWNHEIGGTNQIEASPEWRGLFDLQGEQPLTTADVMTRVHPDDVALVRRTMEQTPVENFDYDIEHRIMRGDGEVRWITSRGRCEPGVGRRRTRIRGASIDITQRKLAEAELAEQRDELAHLSRAASLGELVAALAHELNQPLGSILCNAQTALRIIDVNLPDSPILRDILADIVSEDQRAADVIKRLRALLERGEFSRQPTDLADCMKTATRLYGSVIAERGVAFQADFPPDLPPVLGDPIQIQQVFLNLLANACDACASRPHGDRQVLFRARTDGTITTVEAEDNGAGFKRNPEECFKPFSTTKPRGLGMGLAICKSIVNAHGGTISAASLPGRGAIIRFTLPTTTAP